MKFSREILLIPIDKIRKNTSNKVCYDNQQKPSNTTTKNIEKCKFIDCVLVIMIERAKRESTDVGCAITSIRSDMAEVKIGDCGLLWWCKVEESTSSSSLGWARISEAVLLLIKHVKLIFISLLLLCINAGSRRSISEDIARRSTSSYSFFLSLAFIASSWSIVDATGVLFVEVGVHKTTVKRAAIIFRFIWSSLSAHFSRAAAASRREWNELKSLKHDTWIKMLIVMISREKSLIYWTKDGNFGLFIRFTILSVVMHPSGLCVVWRRCQEGPARKIDWIIQAKWRWLWK